MEKFEVPPVNSEISHICEEKFSKNDVIVADLNHFTKGYPIDNPYGIELINKKVAGVMKDENIGRIIIDF